MTTAKNVKIVGGTEVTNRSEFAYQVLKNNFYIINSNNNNYNCLIKLIDFKALLLYYNSPYCGGIIIEKKYVLTAGHCSFIGNDKVSPSEVKVVVGNLNITDQKIVKNVKNIIVHEDYNMKNFDNDLAIFEVLRKQNLYKILNCLNRQ